MDSMEFLSVLADTLLWECISSQVEDLTQLPALLRHIGNVDDLDTVLSSATHCEIIDSEEFIISDVHEQDGQIKIQFEMPFILTTWSCDEALLRITATASGACSLCVSDAASWKSIDFISLNKEELLRMKPLVRILELNYESVECDDLRTA